MRVCVCVNTRVVDDDFFFEARASLISSSLKKIDPLGLVLLLLLSLFFRVSFFLWVANFFFLFNSYTPKGGERIFFAFFSGKKIYDTPPKEDKNKERKRKRERERERKERSRYFLVRLFSF